MDVNLAQIFTAVERSVRHVDGKIGLGGPFIIFENDEGVAGGEIAEALRGWDSDCMPVPVSLLQKLGLPPGSNITAVADALDTMMHAPSLLTPEEEAEEETALLMLSEAAEVLNAAHPEMPAIPVLYPNRTKH
jgi:hypothetical protein